MSSTGKISILVEAIDKASVQLQNVGKSVGGLSDKIGSLGSTAKVAAGVLLGQLAHDALGALTSAAGKASEGFMDYEKTLTKIVSATAATGKEAEELTAALALVSEAQTDLGFTAADSARGLEALVKAGMNGTDAAKALRSALSLAALEGISTEKSAALLVQTLTMFGLKASDSADALNLLSKAADAGIDTAAGYASGIANAGAAAHNMGLSLDETLAALVQLDKTYGSATESGTYLNSMFKDLIKKSDELGISLYNQDGTMKSLSEIIGELRGKVKSFGTDQEAVNQYLSVFDVRAQRAVIGLINYDGSISDTMDSMSSARDVQEKMNMVMDTTAGKMAAAEAEIENANYALGEMTSQMTLSWKQFALGLGPIGAVADALGPSLLQGAISGVMLMLPQLITKQTLAAVSTNALTVAQYASAAASKVLAAGQWLVNAAMSANPIMIVVIALAALVAGLVWAYQNVGWFRDAINGAGKVLSDFFKPAVDAVVGAVSWLSDAISGFVSWFGPAWSGMTQAATSTWNSFWSGAQSFINDPIGTITSAVTGLAEGMQSKFQQVHEDTGNIWKATWETLKTIPVVGAIVGAVEGLGNQILSVFGLNMDDVFNVWQGAWQSIQNFVADPIGSIQNAVQGLADGMSSKFQETYENTNNIWKSTWESLKTIPVLGEILGAIEGFANQILGIFGVSMDDVFNVWQGAWDAIQNFIGNPIDSITSNVSSFAGAIKIVFQNAHTELTNIWNGMWTAIQDFLRGAADAVYNAVMGLSNNLFAIFHGIQNDVSAIWTNMWNNVVSFLRGAADTVYRAVLGLGRNLFAIFHGIQNDVSAIWTNMWNNVVSFLRGAADTVYRAVMGLATNLKAIFGGLKTQAISIWNSMMNSIKSIVSGFVSAAYNWGRNLINSFINGIKSLAGSVTNAVSNIGSSIAGFLGIGSPAEKGPLRKLMEWGPALTENFAEGILSGLPKVTRAAESIASAFSGLGDVKATVGGFTGGFAQRGALQFNAPLVVIEGDASEATAKLATDLILKNMRKYVTS